MLRNLSRRYKRLRRRGRINFKFGRKFVKVYIGMEAKKSKAETLAAQYVKDVEPWRSLSKICGETYLDLGFISISTANEFEGRKALCDDCVRVAEIIANAVPSDIKVESWSYVFDRRIVAIIECDKYNILPIVDSALSDVTFPVTGAHGDLSNNNVLVSRFSNNFVIIDWETFRENGSCVEDIIRLLFTDIRSKVDPDKDISELAESKVIDFYFINRFLSRYQALIVAIITQATAEIESEDVEVVSGRLKRRFSILEEAIN